jgi:tetratricopeptide (TPR) repeat protein
MSQAKIMKIFSCAGICVMALACPPSADAFVHKDRVAMAKSLAHYVMGNQYDFLEETNYAVLEYEKAVRFDEGSYLIHLRLGTGYARLNMLTEAIEHLEIVHRLNPGDMQSHYLLALIYSNQKQYDKAAREYEMILKTFSKAEPQNIEVYGYLGQLYYSQRKYDQAIDQFEKMLALEPLNADVMYMLGSLYLEVDQKDRAMEILKKSIGIDPEHDGSLNTLGYLYGEEGKDLDEAMDLVSRALKIDPNNGAYLDSLGWIYYKKGMHEKALEILIRADKFLKDPVIYDHMGDVCHKLNRVEDALKYWGLSLEILPGQKDVIQKIEAAKNIQVRK